MQRVLAILMFLVLPGCGYYQQAVTTTTLVEQCAVAYSKNMEAVAESFIADYVVRSRIEADSLADAALKAEIGPDGKANVSNVQIVLNKRLDHYAAIEAVAVGMKKKVFSARDDIGTLLQYTQALRSYFDTKAKIEASVLQDSKQLTDILNALKTKFK